MEREIIARRQQLLVGWERWWREKKFLNHLYIWYLTCSSSVLSSSPFLLLLFSHLQLLHLSSLPSLSACFFLPSYTQLISFLMLYFTSPLVFSFITSSLSYTSLNHLSFLLLSVTLTSIPFLVLHIFSRFLLPFPTSSAFLFQSEKTSVIDSFHHFYLFLPLSLFIPFFPTIILFLTNGYFFKPFPCPWTTWTTTTIVPPEWLIQPKDTRTLLGSPASIDCSVRGSPTPQVIWKRLLIPSTTKRKPFDTSPSSSGSSTSSVTIGINSSNSNQSNSINPAINIASSGHLITLGSADNMDGKGGLQQYHMIRSGPDHQVYENGTLRISRSSIEDRGDYLCAASNGIGPGISKVVHFTVNGTYTDIIIPFFWLIQNFSTRDSWPLPFLHAIHSSVEITSSSPCILST